MHGMARCWPHDTPPTHRSLFVVLDSLACTDGAISAAAQGWLVRALSLGDVARILEPMLLLLLQPKTQRTSIHCLKQENTAGEHTSQGTRGSTVSPVSLGLGGSKGRGSRTLGPSSRPQLPRGTVEALSPAQWFGRIPVV